MNRLERIQDYAFDVRTPLLDNTDIIRLREYLRNPLRRFLYRYRDILYPIIEFNVLLLFLSIAVGFGSIIMLVVDVVRTLMGQSPDYLTVLIPLTISFMFGVVNVFFTNKIFENIEAYHSSEYLQPPSEKDKSVHGKKRKSNLSNLTNLLKSHPEYIHHVEKISEKRPLMQGELDFLRHLVKTKNSN